MLDSDCDGTQAPGTDGHRFEAFSNCSCSRLFLPRKSNVGLQGRLRTSRMG